MKKSIFLLVPGLLFFIPLQSQVNPALHVSAGQTVLFGADTTGAGIKGFWLPSKAAFRVGAIGNVTIGGINFDEGQPAVWDFDSIGRISFAAGYSTVASGTYSTALGSETRAIGGNSTALGNLNVASGSFSTAMGSGTEAAGSYSTAMGQLSKALGGWSTTMGWSTQATGEYATAMGSSTKASGYGSTALGWGGEASGVYSTVMGLDTKASGFASTAMGRLATASGELSTAIGYRVSTDSLKGAFIIGDSDPDDEGETKSMLPDQMVCRFKNGYFFLTSGNDVVQTGIMAANGANAWSSICDLRKKENFQSLDDEKMLQKIASVDYTSWNYRGQDPSTFRHYGIMAQDFFRLFGNDDYGTIGNDTLVNAIDMLGVTMSAIKGAKIRMDKLQEENEIIRNQMIALQKIINDQNEINTLQAEALFKQKHKIAELTKEVREFSKLEQEMVELRAMIGNDPNMIDKDKD